MELSDLIGSSLCRQIYIGQVCRAEISTGSEQIDFPEWTFFKIGIRFQLVGNIPKNSNIPDFFVRIGLLLL